MLPDGDSYDTLCDTRNVLGKDCPDKLRGHTETYRQGVLLPLTLRDCLYYTDTETTDFLKSCLDMTEAALSETVGRYDYKNNGYRYPLSVTAFEYWQKHCTVDYLKREAEKVLRAREKKQSITAEPNINESLIKTPLTTPPIPKGTMKCSTPQSKP